MSLQDSLGDRYTVIELIGEGGAGSVYKARDKVLDVFVAIKVMKQDEGGMAAARLQREAMAAGKLKHKNIAKIFDFGQTSDDLTYMVMEYLPGDNLQMAVKNKTKLPMLEAVAIFIQICDGLGYAHKSGIVHRDLKPSNIVLMKDGKENRISKNPPVAKILDFGIASIESDQRLTTSGAVVGSPAYMSPEQIEISEITAQSDIYSFGCLMHETLSGHPPFEGASVLDTLQMHKNAQPERLTDENIHPDLADLVLDCLQKEPAQRPADTQVVKQRLEKILDAIRVKPQSESAELNPEEAVVLGAKKQNFISRFSNRTALVLSSVVLLGTAIYLSYAGARYLQTVPVSGRLKDDSGHTQSTREADASFYEGDDRFSMIKLDSNSYRAVGAFIKDEDIKDLDKTHVKKLRLEGKDLTGSGIKYLKGAPIQHFELCGENLVDSELKYLVDLPNLTSFCIESDSLGDEALKEVAKCKSIRFLLLMDKKITNKGIAYLEPLKNLNTLKIQTAQIDNDVALELNKLKRLKQLNIGECRKLDKNFGAGLTNLSLLQELSFESGCSKEAIRVLKKLPLMQLGLQKCKLDRAALEELVTMQHLEALSLSSIKCKPSDYEVLAKLPKLSMLDLSDSKEFPDALYNAISKTKIAELDLNRSKVTPAQFLKLARIETLTKVYCIDCPNLSQKDFSEFKDLHKILCRKTVQILGEAPDQTGN
ncbi:MAG: protein kinase [Candidatus Melainabacteria bacterium]|nr:MAG: protein kinase [Candidatus Melainabacteria bacterium]